MIGKLLGGYVGGRVASRHGNGVAGALLGAGAGALARRAFGPLGLALAGGYAAKKLYDRHRARRAARYQETELRDDDRRQGPRARL
ncbi:MAG: hypothetical protein ACFBQW_08890 [Sphingomonadaceae bacterium]